jgi:hypothetical protein
MDYSLTNLSRIIKPASGMILPRVALILSVVIIGSLGMVVRSKDLLPTQFALVTYPDTRAANWVKTNLPRDARLLVNAFPAFYGTSVVGADAGWWLPILAQRSTTLPPLNYAVENEPFPGFRQSVNQLVADIQQYGLDDSRVRSELSLRGVTHVFVGQRQGSLNNPYPPLLDPAALNASPHFRLVYRQDRVYIFEVLE